MAVHVLCSTGFFLTLPHSWLYLVLLDSVPVYMYMYQIRSHASVKHVRSLPLINIALYFERNNVFEIYNGKIHNLCLGLLHVVRYLQCLLSGLHIAVAIYVHTEEIHLVKGVFYLF